MHDQEEVLACDPFRVKGRVTYASISVSCQRAYPSPFIAVRLWLKENKAMRLQRITRVCSNCGRPFEKTDSMPLCHECLAELPGYVKIVEDAKGSSDFVPRRACDGPGFDAGL